MTKKTKDTIEEKKKTKATQQNKKQKEKSTHLSAEQAGKAGPAGSAKTKKAKKPADSTVGADKIAKKKIAELNDKYLRLAAEYDNYRRRTLKERMELTKTAGEDILVNILPVMDDFERALGSIDQAKEIGAVKEGIQLIYNKFADFLKQRGVKEIEAKEKEFDTDLHEAITKIPAPDKKLKGKVIDVIEKGYYLNEKVIRFSKVVIGE
ncbi:MAG: nucleotide exchange factor GrpE [Bacteroidales bacterium]|nr:nucleotide exchange factor GrpE [Bacteroidales bacterium]